ncbi:hypothetical protein [Bacillus suaedae]|uniref:Uncharacterized protein n=1 Tax=Halalkalibacter suaedae TaxID=2822140 RepID=A0A940WPM9_9BACI|nr:hypothetical protein [Bacillus suaedae]MBP3950225.1 hypothetical protein [Bacillus suaedae]
MFKTIFNPKFIVAMIGCLILISGIAYITTDQDRVSKRFAQQLFDYPIPTQTTLIEEKQYNGHPWGSISSGEWVVVVYQRFSTSLSKEEIISYYKKAGLFEFPKGDVKGVIPQLYFEGDMIRVTEDKGIYYESNDGGKKPLYSYFNDEDNIILKELGNNNEQEYEYVIQLISGFDFFLNIH